MKNVLTAIGVATTAAFAMTAVGGDCAGSKAMNYTAGGSCSGQQETVALAAMSNANDIVDTAVSAGMFETLVAAVQAADLVEVLKGDGPFTVFAPTDEAFGDLNQDTLQSLLRPENRGVLQSILTYHVVPGRFYAKDVVDLNGAKTAAQQRVDFGRNAEGGVTVDGANIIKADIECTNGVIHVIDRVIMPSTDNIVATAASAGSFNTLAAALDAAGLVSTLQNDGPFTVFAPTDEAFSKIPQRQLNGLLEPQNRSMLQSVLKYHVVSGRVYAEQAVAVKRARSLEGAKLRFSIKDGSVMVNNAKVIATDIETSNGVIHVIDTVLLP